MKTKLFFLSLLSFITLASANIFAEVSPLGDEPEVSPNFIGFTVGLNQNFQSGIAYPDCPTCKYENGKGVSASFGGLFERAMSKTVNIGVDFGVNFRYIDPKMLKTENDYIDVNGRSEEVALQCRYNAEIKQTSFRLAPYVKYTPASPLFVKLGLSGEFPLSSNLKNTKEIVQKTALLKNGETIDSIYFAADGTNPKSKTKVLQDKAISNLNSFQIYMTFAAGIEFKASKHWFISIYPQYYLPFSNISSQGSGFKISTLQFNLSTRFDF